MPGNATPQFTKQANINSALVDAANTNSDGTGNIATPTMYVCFTADATNGSYVEMANIMVVASVVGTVGTATVIRLYVSNVTAGPTTNANTFLIRETIVQSTTADGTTVAVNAIEVPLGFRLPAGWTILASTAVAAAANSHNRVTVFGGDY